MTPLGRIISWPFSLLASIPLDKWAHWAIGCTLGLAGLWLGVLALIPVIVFAVGKELWDSFHPPHKVELWDAIATVAGGSFAVVMILLHQRFP